MVSGKGFRQPVAHEGTRNQAKSSDSVLRSLQALWSQESSLQQRSGMVTVRHPVPHRANLARMGGFPVNGCEVFHGEFSKQRKGIELFFPKEFAQLAKITN